MLPQVFTSRSVKDLYAENMEMTEEELVREIAGGSESAFRFLVEKHQDMVVNVCNGFLHCIDDSHDVAQEVFVEVFKSIGRFRNESKVSTWLYRIAVNKSLNFLRSKKRRGVIKSIEAFFGSSDTDKLEIATTDRDTMESDERAKVLHRAIDSLAQNQRIAFTLNKYEDMSYKQVAEIMNVSVSSVESLLFRAKKNLQKKLVNFYKNYG